MNKPLTSITLATALFLTGCDRDNNPVSTAEPDNQPIPEQVEDPGEDFDAFIEQLKTDVERLDSAIQNPIALQELLRNAVERALHQKHNPAPDAIIQVKKGQTETLWCALSFTDDEQLYLILQPHIDLETLTPEQKDKAEGIIQSARERLNATLEQTVKAGMQQMKRERIY